MLRELSRALTVMAVAVLALAGCATSPDDQKADAAAEREREVPVYPGRDLPEDPYEGWNRQVYAFNQGFDDWVLRPLARGYDWLLPEPV